MEYVDKVVLELDENNFGAWEQCQYNKRGVGGRLGRYSIVEK